jgi:hypothetical protein
MDDETRDDPAAEQASEAEETLADLSVRASEADKVVGGVIAPCDRSKQ